MPAQTVANPSQTGGQAWLFGPASDLLLGCGLAYVPVFLLLLAFGFNIQQVFPLAIMPLLALFISIPHYGSTLLRVYERREERHKYRLFSVYLTAAVWLWFVAGTRSASLGSALVTLYFVWSPWHYMGQNYGVALMFLGRRRIPVSAELKRLLHLSFLCSFFLAVTEMQSLESGTGHYAVLTLGLSDAVRDGMYLLFGSTYIYATLRAAVMLLRHASIAALLPTALLVFSQALWFLVPLLAIRFNLFQDTVALSMDQGTYAFFWIAIAHAAQYLWITSYYARKEQTAASIPAFLGKALVAGALIWIVPALLFSPALLGTVRYEAGLSLLVAAAVNVHHFILDGAIWKLRQGKIANILLRSEEELSEPRASRLPALVKPALVGIGALCVAVEYVGTVSNLRLERALSARDLQSVQEAAGMLSYVGRDDAMMQVSIANLAYSVGDESAAHDHLNRAIALDASLGERIVVASGGEGAP